MSVCPCCGHKSNTELSGGCVACGARPVGEALPKPDIELPSYGRSLVLAVTGALVMLLFFVQTFVALMERSGRGAKSNLAMMTMIPFDGWSWLAAAETAAWRLKWAAIPIALVVLWFCRKLYRSVADSPDRFCGLRHARRGYIAAAAFPVLVLLFIGLTIPERWNQHLLRKEAALNARAYRIDRALDEYRQKFGGLPDSINDLKKLPDSDRSLAAALKDLDWSGYRPSAELAAVPKQKPGTLRGAAIRNASLNSADDVMSERLSFTNYEMLLGPGADKQLGTDDDLILRDGVVYRADALPGRPGAAATAGKTAKR